MEESNFLKLNRLSEGDYDAFLYDCDGTLADNMLAHAQSYVDVAKSYEVDINPDIIHELAGWPIADVVIELNARYQSAMDPEEFREKKAQIFASHYLEKVVPIDYVVEHLQQHAGKKRIAVVSGGDRAAVERTLEIIGVRNAVEVIVCAGETPKGKPYADPFLKAAELLGVQPEKCLVFEDGIPGVQSAVAAGMHWVRIDEFKFG